MKKLILLFTAVAIAACAYTQTDSTNRKMSSLDISNNQNQNMQNNPVGNPYPDGVMMQNGKMMMVKNGKTTVLDKDMTMSNGTKIMSNGTCIKKDGTKTTMKEGQHMDMSGNMVPAKTNKDKNMEMVPDSTTKKK
ncbi:MAG: DUF6799 domain-containing protein [Bacteroidales bacterium]